MALEILNSVATVSLIFMVVAIGLYYFKELIKGIGEEYQSWRRFKYWVENESRLTCLEYEIKEIKEKVAKNG